MLGINNLLKCNSVFMIIMILIIFGVNMIMANGLNTNNNRNNNNNNNNNNRNYHYNNNQNYSARNLRPPSYEDSNERNVEKILLIFSGTCAPTENDVEVIITELLSTYLCLSIWISPANPDINGIYKQLNGDYKAYFQVANANDSTSCIDHIDIDYNDYCIEVIDYEIILPHQGCIRNGCFDYPDTTDYRWHRDKVDNLVDYNYTHLDTSSRDSVDVYVLDTGVYWTHYEFSKLKSFTLLDPSYDLSQIVIGHGTHVAGIIVGRTSGLSNHSLFDYPVCRGSSGGCYSSYIDDALSVIIARAQLYKRRGVINMSFASSLTQSLSDLPAYLQSYTNDTFATLIQNGIIPVAAAGNSGGDACNSWPSQDPYVVGVGAYDTNFAVPSWSNYGSCVDIYAPGVSIISSWITSNTTYRSASGTSMASPMITAIIADMLWYDDSLTFTQILSTLKSSNNKVPLSSCLSSSSPCYGIKINCTSLYSSPSNLMIATASPTTAAPTTAAPTTAAPTTAAPTTAAPTTAAPTTAAPTTVAPTTRAPTTAAPTTRAPTTAAPTTAAPTTAAPTTRAPTTAAPTTHAPTSPTTASPTSAPTTCRDANVECTTYTQCCSKNCVRRVCA